MNDMEALRRQLGGIIRDARKAKDWQQEQLALAVGLKRTSISNIEAGRQGISLELYCSITEQLDLDPAVVISKLTKSTPKDITGVESIPDIKVRNLILGTLK